MSDRPRAAVDTTAIIALASIDALELLHALFGRIVVPPTVRDELRAGGPTAPGYSATEATGWIEVASLADPRRAELLSDLDRGEAEVIALALEAAVNVVVLDDRLARRHAKRLRLRVTGTIGLLIAAKRRGLIPSVATLVENLQAAGFRLSSAQVAEALRLSGEV